MNTPEKFLVHCKVTCFGGSEKGKCDCRGPQDCELQKHPEFSRYKEKAETRMMRHFRNELDRITDEEE